MAAPIKNILAADIGGTHSRFAIYTAAANQQNPAPLLQLEEELWLQTADYESLEALLTELKKQLRLKKFKLNDVTFAVPGPIKDDICYPPNIKWNIPLAQISAGLSCPAVYLLNDFAAQGFACLYARLSGELATLGVTNIWSGASSAMEDTGGGTVANAPPLAVIGAGSGLGQALILEDVKKVLPSEGGHAPFPFKRSEATLAENIYQQVNASLEQGDDAREVIMEHLVSGSGFARIYEFFSNKTLTPPELTAALAPLLGSIRKGISLEGLNAAENMLLQSACTFADFYGRACQTFMLTTLPLGGLYISGGMAERAGIFMLAEFLEALHTHPTHSAILKDIPVWHISGKQAGLWGAAYYGYLQSCAD